MSTKLPISLVVITLNEEANIERCLRSVPFASDIVVVDTFSSDRTCEIARNLGATVYQEKWQGYGLQKALATSKAQNDWVLNLDADEALSPELQKEILEKFSGLKPEVGYELPRRSYHLGRWINHGGWYPDAQLRLYNRKYAQWSNDRLHEKVQVTHKARFKYDVLHWVFDDLSDQVITNDKYSTLGAQKLSEANKKFSLAKLVFKPWTKFVECYFLKQGFRDGLPGFIIAVGAAYSIFLRHAKLWEMERKNQNKGGHK